MTEVYERLAEWWTEAATWLQRKRCPHQPPWEYEEIRTVDSGERVHWTAMLCCKDCGEVMEVEASFYGNRHQLAHVMAEELERG